MTASRTTRFALIGLVGTATALVADLAQAQVPLPRFKPSFEERANFAEMSVAARRAVLRAVAEGLSARLANDAEDVEAWLRLGQVRMSLGERAAAVEAYERAVALKPRSPSVLRAYASSLLGGDDPLTRAPRVSAAAAALYLRLAELAPADPEPHWYLGLAALQAGAPDRAALHWRRVLALLGPEDPGRALFEARLEQIEAELTAPSRSETFFYP